MNITMLAKRPKLAGACGKVFGNGETIEFERQRLPTQQSSEHKVEVIVNGVECFKKIENEIREFIEKETALTIEKFLSDKAVVGCYEDKEPIAEVCRLNSETMLRMLPCFKTISKVGIFETQRPS